MALLVAAALVGSSLTACGGSWPSSVRGLGDPQFLAHRGDVETIDILPIDMQVWTRADHKRGSAAVAGELDGTLGGTVTAELARRGYDVAAQIDRDGRFIGLDGRARTAMPPDDLAALEDSLSGYGRAQSRAPAGLLVPFLPARLGEATGSDATLYVGGWAFAGGDPSSNKGAKVAKVIGTILLIAVVAVVIIAIARESKGDGGAVGKVATGTARVATGAVRLAGRAALGVARTAGQVAVAIAREPEFTRLTIDAMIEFASVGTHVEVYGGRPDYYAEGPRTGRSAVFLEMTLIDNRTGRTLWHARQRFPASPERSPQVARAVAQLMATLPAR